MTKRVLNMDYIEKNLHNAIETMRDACKEAECRLKETDETPEYRIGQVQHALAWGIANASTGISTALAECSRDREYKEKTTP